MDDKRIQFPEAYKELLDNGRIKIIDKTVNFKL